MSNEYEGPECQQKHVINNHKPTLKKPKENYSIRFHNADNEEVGVMDFNGSGLMYEGNAEEGAIVSMDWVSKTFMERLKEERNRVRTELEAELLALKKGVAANSEYIQGRWDLIGEFQDIIQKGIEK